MNENKAVDLKNIKQGDRVLISRDFASWAQNEWGTVGYERGGVGPKVYMDNLNLFQALDYSDGGNRGAKCYYAADKEILRHIPANKVAMHEGRPVNVEDHGQPNPLAKVIADLTDTHRYLQQVTGKTFEAAIHGFELEVSGDYNSHSVTLRFVEKGK